MVKLLVDSDANVDSKDSDGRTALSLAAFEGGRGRGQAAAISCILTAMALTHLPPNRLTAFIYASIRRLEYSLLQ